MSSKNWYEHPSPSGNYFSPFVPAAKKFAYQGDGTKLPTPKEIIEFMTANPQYEYCAEGKFFCDYDFNSPRQEPIQLPGGAYMYRRASPDLPERLAPLDLRAEKYVELTGITAKVSAHVDDFLNNEAIYRECGLYKLGILLYGPPGCGKSSWLRSFLKNYVPKDAVIIFLDALPSFDFIKKLQTTLPGVLKVFVFEELATAVERMPIDNVLNFLDGEQSVDHSIVIATTNYPEKLPGNLVDRPSRFDALYEIEFPKDSDRKLLLQHFMGAEPSEAEIAATAGTSAAAIKEAVMYGKLKKIKLVDSIKRLKAQSDLAKKAFSKSVPMGIQSRSNEFYD